LLDGLYRGGNDLRDAIDRYVSNDVSISFSNIYPLSLLVADEANATKYEGKDMVATLKGKDNAVKLAILGDKLFYNLTSKIKILYSDETTVLSATILKPTPDLFIPNKRSYWKSVTILYTINRFDDKGMLKEAQCLINRPLLPHQLRNINALLLLEGGESLSSLLASIRQSISIDAPKAIDAATSGSVKTDAAKTDATKTDAAKTDAAKTDAAKTDATKIDAAKTDATKTGTVKTDATKTDAAKTDATKTGTTKTSGAAITDSAKTDATKTDAAKTGATKIAVKTDASLPPQK